MTKLLHYSCFLKELHLFFIRNIFTTHLEGHLPRTMRSHPLSFTDNSKLTRTKSVAKSTQSNRTLLKSYFSQQQLLEELNKLEKFPWYFQTLHGCQIIVQLVQLCRWLLEGGVVMSRLLALLVLQDRMKRAQHLK